MQKVPIFRIANGADLMLPGIIINDDKGIKVLYDLFFLQNFALSLLAIGKIVKINGVKSSVSDPGFFLPDPNPKHWKKVKVHYI